MTSKTRTKRMFTAALVASLCAFSVPTNATAAETSFYGKVVAIADGDTLTVLVDRQQVKVRLEGIDTPEKGQPFGTKAKEALGRLVTGKTVTVRSIGTDRYKRSLGRVFVHIDDKMVDVNHALVAQGLAWWYLKYSDDKVLFDAEKGARETHRGLWADESPVPPWDWRKGVRTYRGPAKNDGPNTGYWLNTTSNVRHNSSCEYFRNTKRGRMCGPADGKPCGMCGG